MNLIRERSMNCDEFRNDRSSGVGAQMLLTSRLVRLLLGFCQLFMEHEKSLGISCDTKALRLCDSESVPPSVTEPMLRCGILQTVRDHLFIARHALLVSFCLSPKEK